MTGHPVPVSSLGFKCSDCFIWNCSYIVYPSKMKGSFRDNYQRHYYLWLAFLMAGWVQGIRRALVLGLVLIADTAIEQAPSVGPLIHHPQTLTKFKTTQNVALKIATECMQDTNTQHLHDETKNLPLQEHLKLHASQIRQKHKTQQIYYTR